MRMIAILALILALGVGALLGGGAAPFGRLALALGLPALAEPLLEDPHWRGIALHRQGRFEEAAEAFREAGPPASYNRGNALALAGRYREALAAYDAVLYRNPQDAEARADRAVVAGLYDGPIGEGREGGGMEAISLFEQAGARKLSEQEIVRQNFTNSQLVANREWLAVLEDEPGLYLKARLAAEQKRRKALGLAAPPAEDPR